MNEVPGTFLCSVMECGLFITVFLVSGIHLQSKTDGFDHHALLLRGAYRLAAGGQSGHPQFRCLDSFTVVHQFTDVPPASSHPFHAQAVARKESRT